MIYEKYRLQEMINIMECYTGLKTPDPPDGYTFVPTLACKKTSDGVKLVRYRSIDMYLKYDIFYKDYYSPNSIMKKYITSKPEKYFNFKTKDTKIIWIDVIDTDNDEQMLKEIFLSHFNNIQYNYYPQSIVLCINK